MMPCWGSFDLSGIVVTRSKIRFLQEGGSSIMKGLDD